MLEDCEVINVVAAEDAVEKDVVNKAVGEGSQDNDVVNDGVEDSVDDKGIEDDKILTNGVTDSNCGDEDGCGNNCGGVDGKLVALSLILTL